MTFKPAVGNGALATPNECAWLSIAFSRMTDITTKLTRQNSVPMPPHPKRHFEVTMTFSSGGTVGPNVYVNDIIIPYVSSAHNDHGALSRPLLDRIRDRAAVSGYNVAVGDGMLVSTSEYWWTRLKYSSIADVCVAKPGGVKLLELLQKSRKGVNTNLVLSITLQCAILEATKDGKSRYYDWNEASPAHPDGQTQWTVSPTVMGGFIVGVGVDIELPAKVEISMETRSGFNPRANDKPTDELETQLAKWGFD